MIQTKTIGGISLIYSITFNMSLIRECLKAIKRVMTMNMKFLEPRLCFQLTWWAKACMETT